jgi:hypothetical protein
MEMIIEEIEPVKKNPIVYVFTKGSKILPSFNFKRKTTAEYCFYS